MGLESAREPSPARHWLRQPLPPEKVNCPFPGRGSVLTQCRPGAGSSLENAVWVEDRAALGDKLRIGFEQKRAHVAVVKRGS